MADLEDVLLGLFGAGGALTFLAGALQQSPDPRLEAVGGLLLAIGAILKAFVPVPKPTTP